MLHFDKDFSQNSFLITRRWSSPDLYTCNIKCLIRRGTKLSVMFEKCSFVVKLVFQCVIYVWNWIMYKIVCLCNRHFIFVQGVSDRSSHLRGLFTAVTAEWSTLSKQLKTPRALAYAPQQKRHVPAICLWHHSVLTIATPRSTTESPHLWVSITQHEEPRFSGLHIREKEDEVFATHLPLPLLHLRWIFIGGLRLLPGSSVLFCKLAIGDSLSVLCEPLQRTHLQRPLLRMSPKNGGRNVEGKESWEWRTSGLRKKRKPRVRIHIYL